MHSGVLWMRVWVFVALALCWAAACLCFYLDGKVRSQEFLVSSAGLLLTVNAAFAAKQVQCVPNHR
ncbi:uncharacterized protein K441DRAFT_656124 [Cenococcum geophilum 1.58]|uniref:uncharacterized protein n=1 Tax=Cenococcum geophilum 1.58 TaxID=794803 RepID=UPI00358FAC0C|nr:hypothetical protein K441DRAFT_656124 [Cenococcum geophilum 1.58]